MSIYNVWIGTIRTIVGLEPTENLCFILTKVCTGNKYIVKTSNIISVITISFIWNIVEACVPSMHRSSFSEIEWTNLHWTGAFVSLLQLNLTCSHTSHCVIHCDSDSILNAEVYSQSVEIPLSHSIPSYHYSIIQRQHIIIIIRFGCDQLESMFNQSMRDNHVRFLIYFTNISVQHAQRICLTCCRLSHASCHKLST